MIVGIVGGVIILASIAAYVYASKLNQENDSKAKKEKKAELKRRSRKARLGAHSLLGAGIVLVLVALLLNAAGSANIEDLNYKEAIDVRQDPNYGAGHSEMPVQYEMALPTSGTHSPHDLKFGFYETKPATEMLVHNLEHGDIEIYYRSDADATLLEELKKLTAYRKAGAGVLAIPADSMPEGKEVVLTAWTRTMELDKFDLRKAGTFIYEYINQGPEKIPASIRRGGGTM
jgi:hypothetical protein